MNLMDFLRDAYKCPCTCFRSGKPGEESAIEIEEDQRKKNELDYDIFHDTQACPSGFSKQTITRLVDQSKCLKYFNLSKSFI